MASAGVITRGCPAVHCHINSLVALPSAQDLLHCTKHLFVAAMVAWVHPGPAGKSANQNMTAGQSGLGAVKFYGRQAPASLPVVAPRFIGNVDFLVALPPAQDWLRCAKHLFVAAMVAWVYPGPSAQDLLLCAKHLFVAAERALAATRSRGVLLGGHREQSDINKAEAVGAPMDSITSELSGLSARGAGGRRSLRPRAVSGTRKSE